MGAFDIETECCQLIKPHKSGKESSMVCQEVPHGASFCAVFSFMTYMVTGRI